MPEFMPAWPLFSAFLLASLVLAVTHGPGVLYIVALSLAQGRARDWYRAFRVRVCRVEREYGF